MVLVRKEKSVSVNTDLFDIIKLQYIENNEAWGGDRLETIIKIKDEKNNTERLEFKVTREMNYKYITPIVKNLEWKLNNNWDDYNEVAHCCSLLEKYKSMEGAWVDIHIIEKNEIVLGCLFIVGGKADYSGYGA